MKKVFMSISIILVVFTICGCSTNGFDLSNVSAHDKYIKGTIKNSSGKDCNTVRINVILKNGSIKTSGFIYISETLEDEEVYQFDELVILDSENSGNIDDLSDYNVKITNIECTD